MNHGFSFNLGQEGARAMGRAGRNLLPCRPVGKEGVGKGKKAPKMRGPGRRVRVCSEVWRAGLGAGKEVLD